MTTNMTTETTARIDAAEYARQQKLIDEWLAQRLDGLRRSMRLPADDAAWNLYDEERFAIQARVQSLEHQNLRNLQGPCGDAECRICES